MSFIKCTILRFFNGAGVYKNYDYILIKWRQSAFVKRKSYLLLSEKLEVSELKFLHKVFIKIYTIQKYKIPLAMRSSCMCVTESNYLIRFNFQC